MSRHRMVDQEQLYSIMDDMKLHDTIKLDEMPEYRLYISQLEEFFERKLGRGTGDDEERKTISKTMIQNYIKDGLLMPPEGKCYNQNHVILLTLIYHLKPVLSIKDIKKLLSPILTDVDDEGSTSEIQHLYNGWLQLKEDGREDFDNVLTAGLDRAAGLPGRRDMTDSEWDRISLLLFIVNMIAHANAQKKLAEHLIDKFF